MLLGGVGREGGKQRVRRDGRLTGGDGRKEGRAGSCHAPLVHVLPLREAEYIPGETGSVSQGSPGDPHSREGLSAETSTQSGTDEPLSFQERVQKERFGDRAS